MARWIETRGLAQRLRTPAADLTGVRVPVALAGGLLFALMLVTLVMRAAGVEARIGSGTLSIVAAAIILLAFLRLPKPALLVFALFMLFSDTIARYLGFSILQVDELVVPPALALTAWRARPWQTGRLSLVREAAVVSVLALAVLSSLVNGVPAGVWLPGFLLLAKVIAFLYVAAWNAFEPSDVRQFVPVVLGVALVVTALGYVEAIDPPAFRQALGLSSAGSARGELPSVKSVFYHPVLYGWFAAVAALYLFAGWVVYRRWWMLLLGVFFSAGVMLSARRRAIAGLAAALLLGGLAQLGRGADWRALARSWAPVGVSMVLLLVAFSSGIGELVRLTGEDYVDPVVQPGPAIPIEGQPGVQGEAARVALYRGSVTVAADHFPLGAGLGRYGSWMSRVEYSPLYAELGFDQVWGLRPEFPNFITDTFWPQILGEIGVFGVLAYLVFVAAVGGDLWRAARTVRQPLLVAFCLGTLMVFGHALVETLASSMFHSPPRVYLLFGAVGMALALLHRARATDRTGAT